MMTSFWLRRLFVDDVKSNDCATLPLDAVFRLNIHKRSQIKRVLPLIRVLRLLVVWLVVDLSWEDDVPLATGWRALKVTVRNSFVLFVLAFGENEHLLRFILGCLVRWAHRLALSGSLLTTESLRGDLLTPQEGVCVALASVGTCPFLLGCALELVDE